MVEQGTFNPEVAGSIPVGSIMKNLFQYLDTTKPDYRWWHVCGYLILVGPFSLVLGWLWWQYVIGYLTLMALHETIWFAWGTKGGENV